MRNAGTVDLERQVKPGAVVASPSSALRTPEGTNSRAVTRVACRVIFCPTTVCMIYREQG